MKLTDTVIVNTTFEVEAEDLETFEWELSQVVKVMYFNKIKLNKHNNNGK